MTKAIATSGNSPGSLWITGMNHFGGFQPHDTTRPYRLRSREETPA